jgi:hypothetical protein
MIGKKTSEVQPIAKDETREEEKFSANGTIRQELLDELESTRNLFELMIFNSVHGCKLDGLSGACAMQIKCIHGGGATGVASVEEVGLGCGHEFMHEHEHKCMLAILGSSTMAQFSRTSQLKPAIEALKLLYNPLTAVRPLETVLGSRLCAIRTSHTSIVAL